MNLQNSKQFDVITNYRDMASLGPEWRELERAHGVDVQLFQTFSWQDAWWRTSGEAEDFQLNIITGRSDGDLVLVWPLVKKRIGPVWILEQGSGILACYDDLLINADLDLDDWVGAVWRFTKVLPEVDALQLRAVRETSKLWSMLRSTSPDPISSTGALSIASNTDADVYFSGLSKGMRKQQRRTWGRLRKLGNVRTTIDDPALSPDEALTNTLKFKRDWINEHGLKPSPLVSRSGEAFLREYFRLCEADAELRISISTLLLDERLIALGIGFQFKRRHYDYLGAFDPAYRNTGCGRLQMELCIRHCFDDDVDVFDLLTPDTDSKRRWTEDIEPVGQYFVPLTVRGRLYGGLYLRRVRPIIKRAFNAVPVVLRRMFTGAKQP